MATGSGSSGDKRARKVKQRQQKRLAQEASSRERHAQLVVERSGDPAYVQSRRNPDGGRTISWRNDSPTGARLTQAMTGQRQAFVDKFGREPGPDDPLMFDPDSDTPRALTEEQMNADIDDLIATTAAAGRPTAYLRAWRDTGFLVSERNQHLFSAADLDKWNEAVERYWDDDDHE